MTNSQFDFSNLKWVVSNDIGNKILFILRNSILKDFINLELSNFSYQYVYSQCVKKLLNLRPNILQYQELMLSKELEQISQHVMWIILYDFLPRQILQNDINKLFKTIFDNLSIQYAYLRKKLSTISSLINEKFIDNWTYAICATILQMTISEFSESELVNSPDFVISTENSVKILLDGFPSSNIHYFHQSVWPLLSPRAHRLIPKNLIPIIKNILIDHGSIENNELSLAIQLEPHYESIKKHSNDILFTENTRTNLIKNALKLSGTKGPFDLKGRIYKKGSSEKSNIIIKKTQAIIKQTNTILENHINERNNLLFEICDRELECNNILKTSNLKPLNFSFENFGFDPINGKLAILDNNTSKNRTSWKNNIKNNKKPLDIFNFEEMKNILKESHIEILKNGI